MRDTAKSVLDLKRWQWACGVWAEWIHPVEPKYQLTGILHAKRQWELQELVAMLYLGQKSLAKIVLCPKGLIIEWSLSSIGILWTSITAVVKFNIISGEISFPLSVQFLIPIGATLVWNFERRHPE